MATNNPFANQAQSNPFIPGGSKAKTTPKEETVVEEVKNVTPLPGKGSAINNDVFDVDLTDVENNFLIPDSLYLVKCIDLEQGVSSSGNPQYIWSFTILDGEFSGREFKLWTALTPAAMWKVAEVVVALGIGETGKAVRFRKSDVIGKTCVASIEQSEYKNQLRSSIQRVMTLAEAQEMK